MTKRHRKAWMRAISMSAALAAMFVALVPWLLKRAFAPPRRAVHVRPGDLGLPEEEVWLDSAGGTRLHGWLVPVEGSAPAVVVIHGWTGSAAELMPLATRLHEAALHALFLDARNHGLSEDDDHVSMPRFAEDLAVAVEYLSRRDEVTNVGLIGHSVGAAAAILAAARGVDVGAVVSVSCFAHPRELMEAQLPLPKPLLSAVLRVVEIIIGHRYDEIAPRNRIEHVPVPVMLVHGDCDDVVPVADAYELNERLPESRLLIVAGASHSDLDAFEPRLGEVTEFLSSCLS